MSTAMIVVVLYMSSLKKTKPMREMALNGNPSKWTERDRSLAVQILDEDKKWKRIGKHYQATGAARYLSFKVVSEIGTYLSC